MTTTNGPLISIIVAGVNVRQTLRGWLEAIAPQLEGRDGEVVLAIGDGDLDFVRTLENRFDGLQIVTGPGSTLVPGLWGKAIARARGEILAVTISSCRPAPDWLEAILTAHASPHAGIGGVIDVTAGGSLVDRALHLVRYTPYLPPLAAGPVEEIAGDNGTYKRRAFEGAIPEIEREGFWEADRHRQLRAAGEHLWVDPRIRVTHARSYSAADFSRQRFVHGRHFGRTRRRSLSPGASAVHALLAPIVPAVMLARHVRTVSKRHRLDGQAMAAAPLALWFLTCWAWGEAVGLLGG